MTTETKIHRKLTIQDVFNLFPSHAQKLAGIMTSHGLHCVGCHASVFETLEQGILGHGFSEEKLEEMVAELNQAIVDAPVGKTIIITDKASEVIQQLLKDDQKESWGLGFKITALQPEFEYDLSFKEKIAENETLVEENNITLFIPKDDLGKLLGTKIDYVETEEESGFKIENPNEKN